MKHICNCCGGCVEDVVDHPMRSKPIHCLCIEDCYIEYGGSHEPAPGEVCEGCLAGAPEKEE